ncbi:radical SAM protein [Candidatus Woesearchaeota archaeon]|nr:radical SAM protein [Candidatus Woesearchaeota archaeon]
MPHFLEAMAELQFKDLCFRKKEEEIEVAFLRIFFFTLKKSSLKKIGDYEIGRNKIIFRKISLQKAENKFNSLLRKGFNNLKNKLTGNAALYIHKNSGIPLIGSLSFGIIDKGTDMLELKPITGCNLDCIFCSVDEGCSTKKTLDIVIEKSYLVRETKKLLEYKKQPVHIYINPHGEPLLYSDIVELIADLNKIKYVKSISIITNAALLTENLAEQLISAGLTGINVSINSLNPKKSKELAGSSTYDINRVISVLGRTKDRIKITIAPVLIDGINNKDIEELVRYAKKNNFEILIQNFLLNKRGRKPAKQLDFKKFYDYLEKLGKKYGISLIKKSGIKKTGQLEKPFRKNDIIRAEIISKGRYKDEYLGRSKNRIITVKSSYPLTNTERIRITGDRYNIFYGIAL